MRNLTLFLILLFANACSGQTKPINMNKNQKSVIIEAVKNNRLQEVETLLKQGIDVDVQNEHRQSLLLTATHEGYFEMAKLLVFYGADVNKQDEQLDSPFLYAGASGQTEFVKLFLTHGARFDVFNRYNGTALIPACERGHVETVKVLTQTSGFPINHVNRLGWTALMEAVILGNGSEKYQQIVTILVNAGCDIDIADKNGVTPLQHARSLKYDKIVKILENAGH
nr:ankyrin repeat domain-containing protein [Pedobacter montanisoli]